MMKILNHAHNFVLHAGNFKLLADRVVPPHFLHEQFIRHDSLPITSLMVFEYPAFQYRYAHGFKIVGVNGELINLKFAIRKLQNSSGIAFSKLIP
jgi:hypothetical protein